MIFATIRNAPKITPITATKANAISPSTTQSGHQRRSNRSTFPRSAFQAGSVPRSGADGAGGGGGLPSISRTSASIVSGTPRSFAEVPVRAIRSSARSWKQFGPRRKLPTRSVPEKEARTPISTLPAFGRADGSGIRFFQVGGACDQTAGLQRKSPTELGQPAGFPTMNGEPPSHSVVDVLDPVIDQLSI